MVDQRDIDNLLTDVSALWEFIEEFLPPLIAASPNRQLIEAQLRQLSDQVTTDTSPKGMEEKAEIADAILARVAGFA